MGEWFKMCECESFCLYKWIYFRTSQRHKMLVNPTPILFSVQALTCRECRSIKTTLISLDMCCYHNITRSREDYTLNGVFCVVLAFRNNFLVFNWSIIFDRPCNINWYSLLTVCCPQHVGVGEDDSKPLFICNKWANNDRINSAESFICCRIMIYCSAS